MVIVKDDKTPLELSFWDLRVTVERKIRITDIKDKGIGRPTIKEIPLPPDVQWTLIVRSNGSSWKDAAEAAGMDYQYLGKNVWDHPNANEFLERQTLDTLDQSHSRLIAAALLAPQRLIHVINDEKNRFYVVIQAVESLYWIIDRGITDRENAKHIKEIKESFWLLREKKLLISK